MTDTMVHPTHKIRGSDSSYYDMVCINCNGTDITGFGLGKLALPCPVASHEGEVKYQDNVSADKNPGTKRRTVSAYQILRIIFVPTLALTENSERKIVRALGRIGTIIPFLPLTILFLLLLILAGFITDCCESVQNKVRRWWDSV